MNLEKPARRVCRARRWRACTVGAKEIRLNAVRAKKRCQQVCAGVAGGAAAGGPLVLPSRERCGALVRLVGQQHVARIAPLHASLNKT